MLNEKTLAAEIKAAYDAESDNDRAKPDESRDRIAKAIAKAVIKSVKAADITVIGVAVDPTSHVQVAPIKAKIG